jgi:hypothetical protein
LEKFPNLREVIASPLPSPKILLAGLLFASPALFWWHKPADPPAHSPLPAVALNLPVEITHPGTLPQWRHVEVPLAAVPEPASMPLALLGCLLLLRRHRRTANTCAGPSARL